jgi:hypothetical protein
VANSCEGYLQAIEGIKTAHAALPEEQQVCNGWLVPDHDLALIVAIKENGIKVLKKIKHDDRYKLYGLKINRSKL